MNPKKGLVPLGLLVLVTKVGTVAASTPGVGRDAAWIYVLAIGTPVAVTLLFLGYVYVSTTKQGEGQEEGTPREPVSFDYTEIGNQLVVTYEGDASWDRDSLVVRHGGGSGSEGEETVEQFDTSDDEVKQGDGLSVNAGSIGRKIEVVWDGEVVDEYLLEG